MPDSAAAAFERTFRAEHAALVAFCYRRTSDAELAQDLAADAFRIAWARWDEPRRSTRAWLFGVARNLIGNEYRRRGSQPVVPLLADGNESDDRRPASATTSVDVRSALATLQPSHQEVLRLTYWEGLSAAEAAEALGTTTAAVWVRLTRARRAFAQAWQDEPVITSNSTSSTSTRRTS